MLNRNRSRMSFTPVLVLLVFFVLFMCTLTSCAEMVRTSRESRLSLDFRSPVAARAALEPGALGLEHRPLMFALEPDVRIAYINNWLALGEGGRAEHDIEVSSEDRDYVLECMRVIAQTGKTKTAQDRDRKTLRDLRRDGTIERLCATYGMSLWWFDRIATVESGYGSVRNNTWVANKNAWGWGSPTWFTSRGATNWYESSEMFIRAFVKAYGGNPSAAGMRRYCPSGAYDKYFGGER